MTNEIEDFKGKRMLERAEELDTFWAYTTEKRYRPRLCVKLVAIKIIRAYPPNNK